jgi:hypothetical protein
VSGDNWAAIGPDSVAEFEPCEHFTQLDQLAMILMTGVGQMIRDHGPQETGLSGQHDCVATIAGRRYGLSVTWTIHPPKQEVTDHDRTAAD